jgi:hypothetical protein
MLRAFEAAGLDHRNPTDWRMLVSCFAEAHFGKKKTKPLKWDVLALCRVLKDYMEVTRNHPELKDSKVCERLKSDKQYKDKYSRYKIHALRRIVRCAKSPKHNIILRHPEMRNPVLQCVRDMFERRGMPWDEELGQQMAEAFKQMAGAHKKLIEDKQQIVPPKI